MARLSDSQQLARPSRGALRAVLSLIGVVATFEGARGVVQGASQVVDGGRVSANVDSEYRFYAAWYHVLGLLLLSAARRPEAEARIIRACAGGFLLAACGRVLSMRAVGPPHRLQKVLMALEFVIPAVIVPWQAQVARELTTDGQDRSGSRGFE
jgi:hypothetical protein